MDARRRRSCREFESKMRASSLLIFTISLIDRKYRRRSYAKALTMTAYGLWELQGSSGRISLRGARCVTVRFLGSHVISSHLLRNNVELLKTRRHLFGHILSV